MFGITPLTPAYGRDYKNKKEVLEDFNLNKDFNTSMGQPINKDQIIDMGLHSVNIRYKKLTQVAVVPVK